MSLPPQTIPPAPADAEASAQRSPPPMHWPRRHHRRRGRWLLSVVRTAVWTDQGERMRRLSRLPGLLLLTLFAACASTQLTNSWTNHEYVGRLPGKILVVALVPGESVRRQVEQLEVERL